MRATKPRQPTAERRKQIAEAALSILAERGVKSLTSAELAKRVGIADATIFRHFKDKQEIGLAAIEHLEELMFASHPPTDADPIDRIRSFFFAHLEMVQGRPELVQLMMSDRLFEVAGPAGLNRLLAIGDRAVTFVRDCLKEAAEKGLIGRSLQADVLAVLVMGAMKAGVFARMATTIVPQLCHGAATFRTSAVEPGQLWATLEAMLRQSAVA